MYFIDFCLKKIYIILVIIVVRTYATNFKTKVFPISIKQFFHNNVTFVRKMLSIF